MPLDSAEEEKDPTIEMFDEAAERGTRLVDSQVATGTYHRGTFLLDSVLRATPRAGRVLDYGCGAGRISMLMARAGLSILGVEPSRELYRLAAMQVTDGLLLEFRHLGPSKTDGLEPESFDGILCSSVIEFVTDPEALLRCFRDLLRPGGRLFLSYANRRSLWRRYAEWRFGGRERHFSRQRNIWTEPEAWQVLNRAGLARATPTTFFESPFDGYRLLKPLSRLSPIGTLGLLVAGR